jgi:hypothetical protein
MPCTSEFVGAVAAQAHQELHIEGVETLALVLRHENVVLGVLGA